MAISRGVVTGVLVGAMVAGVGAAFGVSALVSEQDFAAPPKASASAPQGSPTPTSGTETPETKAPLLTLSQLTVIPGAVGPVRAGMSRDKAMATGYLDYNLDNEECEAPAWQWKPDYRGSLDLAYPSDGSKVAAIGIRGEYPRTRSDYGVGTTWEELKSVVDEGPREAGYAQTGVFVKEGDGWIGFLFDASPDVLSGNDTVQMMEVSVGARPGLMRDGC